jgi:hypothetical protein
MVEGLRCPMPSLIAQTYCNAVLEASLPYQCANRSPALRLLEGWQENAGTAAGCYGTD